MMRLFHRVCLLYTSDAADEEDSVDLGGFRIIKKKKQVHMTTFGSVNSHAIDAFYGTDNLIKIVHRIGAKKETAYLQC